MSDEPKREKKIFVDESWKARVEAEKEEYQRRKESGEAETTPQEDSVRQWPEPSLALLFTTMATQAMVAMGLVPHPASGKAELRVDEEKHFVDTLQMLQEKTEGNRTPEENSMLDNVLHELRMSYLAVRQNAGQ